MRGALGATSDGSLAHARNIPDRNSNEFGPVSTPGIGRFGSVAADNPTSFETAG